MSPFRFVTWGVLLVVMLATSSDAAAIRVRAVDGRMLAPFEPARRAHVIFFVQTDCPVSNSYAPEIQRICREYSGRGVDCMLMYEDVETPTSRATLDAAVQQHLRDYRYGGMTAAVDRTRTVARQVGATITPQAVAIDRSGTVQYRGRIDNFYAALGRPRQQVTERDLRDALDAILAGKPVPRREAPPIGCHIVDPQSLEHNH